ncbi:NAD(P)-dependent oxidoreductase [Negadavirga shengliensis]|uniref:NAD(P)-dependent oxidoreductase n=1 Tax=Negadavirga shengliensis TaxID=1389218 RepID=A0ABV9T8D3_9BACT
MKILVTAPYHREGLKDLETYFGEVVYKSWKPHGRAFNEDELIRLLRETDAEALITEHDEVSQRVVENNSHLKFIGVCRGTPSNVSLETTKKYGIPVFNTPARNAQAVAELFVSNVIMLLRNTSAAMGWLEEGRWAEGSHTSYLQFKGNELAGKTVGMVGFGAVGQRMANLIRHFPCQVIYFDPYIEKQQLYKSVGLEEVFSKSDIVSINLPAVESTRGMIDRKLFDLMKKDAVFVNMSRAVVVKREDLLETLKSKQIRGAILDVFDHEPPDELDYELIRLPSVLATPHIAGATHEVENHHVEIMNKVLFDHFVEENNLSQKP